MQHTTKYQQTDQINATHKQISTNRPNPCTTQKDINNTIKPMRHTTKYQQHAKTHATHNQISTN